MTAHDIILKPVLTEKSYAGIPNKVYTFIVAKDANKIQIRNAVEELFEVKVAKVNTLNCKGKIRTRNTKSGVTPVPPLRQHGVLCPPSGSGAPRPECR